MKNENITALIATIILMMFLYASFSKYFDFNAFQRGMHSQPFPGWFSTVLIIGLPPLEIFISFLLYREKTRKKGLKATVFLMSLFTLYIIAILLHFFKWVPCSCGGFIKYFSWWQHLFFNLFFLVIAVIGLKIQNSDQRINFTADMK